MNSEEITIIKAYLINEGLRRDSEVICARQAYLNSSHNSRADTACMRLLRAHVAKATFDKVCNDLCALLNI